MVATVISSFELAAIMEYAKKLARRHERGLMSLHIVVAAMEKSPNQVRSMLETAGVRTEGDNGLMAAAARLKQQGKSERLTEPDDTLKLLHTRACDMAQRYESHVNSLFYFITLIRMRKSVAMRVMDEAGVDFKRLRQMLLSGIAKLTPVHARRGGPDDVPEASPEEPALKPVAEAAAAALKKGRSTDGAASSAISQGDEPPGRKWSSGAALAEEDDFSQYSLDPARFPVLIQFTTNLSLAAARGEIDPIIGRLREVRQMVQILKKRRSNNPCLLGDPGVGKTALVEGLALEAVKGEGEYAWLKDKIILSLETASLVAGTQLRGSFSERMQDLKREVTAASGRVIIFIDEIHTIVGAGGGDTALDAANELKTVLARGRFPLIGATTLDEYKKYIERDPALERRFQRVDVKEPSVEETREIARGIISFYEEHHGLAYAERAIDAAVRLSARYIMDRKLPAKAIELLDTAGARVSGMRNEVTEEDVAEVLSEEVGIPIERILLGSENRFREMGEFLRRYVVGHEGALNKACDAIKRGFAGFSSSRPLASFLFAGPPGVGKSQTAKALARFLFRDEDAILDFNGNEFTEQHSIAKLIGSAPGFVGHQEGGRLTEAMYRRPFRIIMFRDFLAAHQDVQDLVSQMMLNGYLTDGRSRRAYFTNSVVILVQDLQSDKYFGGGKARVGFAPAAQAAGEMPLRDEILSRMRREMPSTLFNVVDEKLVFFPLDEEEMVAVAKLEVSYSSDRLKEERNMSFGISDAAAEHLIRSGGFTARGGGRLMRQTLSRTVESFLADRIHAGEVGPGHHVLVDYRDDKLVYDIS